MSDLLTACLKIGFAAIRRGPNTMWPGGGGFAMGRRRQVFWRFTGSINGWMPPSPRQCSWHTKIDSIAAAMDIRQSARCSSSWIRQFMGISTSQSLLEKRSGT